MATVYQHTPFIDDYPQFTKQIPYPYFKYAVSSYDTLGKQYIHINLPKKKKARPPEEWM